MMPWATVGSVTETTQLSWSYESCEELRSERFDETGILTGATPLGGLVKCQQNCFHVVRQGQFTEGGLLCSTFFY